MLFKRIAIFAHRWLGVALCLFFLLWFPSGIGMMYWDFPSVTEADRLDRSPALDPSTIHLSSAEAFAVLRQSEPPTELHLNTFDGRPAYRFRVGRGESIVYADTGERQTTVSKEMALRIASAWVRQPPGAAEVETIDDADQWTVEGTFRALRPISRYSWPTGEQVYVSHTSGDVVQFTTTASRIGAYLGPIPHWLYFTPLRKHQPQWSRVVIWSSGIGTFAAILGLVVGVWMYSPSRRYRLAGATTGIPYRGQKRWHMIFGLVFGLGAVTWAFSGMLSMDPFPMTRAGTAPERGPATGGIPQALRDPLELGSFADQQPRDVLSLVADLRVKELELTSIAGQPVYLAHLGGGDTRIVTADGRVRTEFDRERVVQIATQAAAPIGLADIRVLDQYDLYYLDRHRKRPLPVILVALNDAEHTRYYLDPKTARLVATYSSRNWATRWLYHGLHSLDVPWLYNHRPAWDILVLTFMLGGTALSVTSLLLAWRVLGRTLTRSLAVDATSPDVVHGEDPVAGIEPIQPAPGSRR
jgi:hypothetical protein